MREKGKVEKRRCGDRKEKGKTGVKEQLRKREKKDG